jgi:PAS domain S-box-containing protein
MLFYIIMNMSTIKKIDSISEQILDSIADGVFTVDNDWNITFFNKAAEKITGVSKKHALGQKCWEVFHAEICERECFLKKTLKSRKPHVNKTINIINLSGKTVPVSISTSMLCDKDGSVLGGVETFRDISEIELLRKEVEGKNCLHDILTINPRMLDILNKLPIIAESDTPVLITGESGTGKELFARAVHKLSSRTSKPFIAINCGALPENLLESELFGYRKGAFTDAKTDKPGRFDLAKGGTLFLDEIGDMPKSLQVKLLRVLQEKQFEPLGSTKPVNTDVRIIAATNKDLASMVESGDFRKDLFYRIHVLPIHLPPLRDRKDDIPLLIKSFLNCKAVASNNKHIMVTPEAMNLLTRYNYPGNIRELENIIQYASILCLAKPIQPDHLPSYITQPSAPVLPVNEQHPESINEFEKNQILNALQACKHKKSETARYLGIHVTTLWRKMKQLGIS